MHCIKKVHTTYIMLSNALLEHYTTINMLLQNQFSYKYKYAMPERTILITRKIFSFTNFPKDI